MSKKIWRECSFTNSTCTTEKIVKKGLILRNPKDVYYDRAEEKVFAFAQLKSNPHAFRVLSCSLTFPRLISEVLHQQDEFPTNQQRKQLEKNLKAQHSLGALRFVIGIYLDIGDLVNDDDWIVDADDAGSGHVAIAVAKTSGLEAYEPENSTDKVSINALEALPWKVENKLFVLKSEANWREDFLPNDDAWHHIVDVLNMILAHGTLEDFYAVWDIYHSIHDEVVSACPLDIKTNILENLNRILEVFHSYKNSDCYDYNSPEPALDQAICYVKERIRKIIV